MEEGQGNQGERETKEENKKHKQQIANQDGRL
jgi:hypothetical protein